MSFHKHFSLTSHYHFQIFLIKLKLYVGHILVQVGSHVKLNLS